MFLLTHSALTAPTHLDADCIYGALRCDVIGADALGAIRRGDPQHTQGAFVTAPDNARLGSIYVDPLRGFVPIGFFQLWNAACQKPYPYSLGDAAHDDVLFAAQWPRPQRRLLPTVICHHLCATPPKLGENWDGNRRQPRLATS